MKITEDPQFEPGDEGGDAALDLLLAMARWPDTDDALRRSENAWRQLSHRRRIAQVAWPAALAASIIFATGIGFWMLRFLDRGETIVEVLPLHLSMNVDPVPDESPEEQYSRPATMYEQLMLVDASNPSSKKAPQLAAPKVQMQSEPVAQVKTGVQKSELILQTHAPDPQKRRQAMQELLNTGTSADLTAYLACVADPLLRTDALAVIDGMDNPPANALLEKLNSPLVEHRYAAARVLAEICDSSVSDRLKEMIVSNTNRREALAVLVACRDPQAETMLGEAAKHRPILRIEIDSLKQEMLNLY